MSTEFPLPIGAFDRPTIWGRPWHGLVSGGVLTLPNGSTMAHPQPAGTADQAGAAYRVAVPGTPAVFRTTEQLADDTAAGRQWRSVATLSGSRMQLYGQHLDGWIYVDPAGARWLVKTGTLLTAAVALGASITATITLTRFGDFSAAPLVVTRTVTLADPGQGAPIQAISGAALETYWVMLCDLSPQGDRAALMMHALRFSADAETDNYTRYPLGYIELALTGAGSSPTVTLSVLRTRAQTIQSSYVVSGPGDFTYRPILIDIWWNNKQDHAAYITQDGVETRPPEVTMPWNSESTMLPARTQHLSATGFTLLAVWWVDGAWTDVVLSMESDVDYHSADPSFRLIAGAPGIGPPGCQAGCDRVVTISSEFNVSIKVGDTQVYATSGSNSASITETIKQLSVLESAVVTASRTIDGVTTDESRTVGERDLYDLSNWSFNIPTYVSPVRLFGGPLKLSPSAADRVGSGRWQVLDAPVVGRDFSLVRYSSHLIGVVAREGDSSYLYLPPITISGAAAGSPQTRTFSPQSRRLYGSACPVTGQVSWLAESPVCWV
ncbi:MAG: hypothetical protein Q7J47_03380 [Azoarcus sp.]|nr:hypothetical protein [Azoarcus sp.]